MEDVKTDEADATPPRRRSSRRSAAIPRDSGADRAQKRKRVNEGEGSPAPLELAASVEATPARKRKSVQLAGTSSSMSGNARPTASEPLVAGTPRQRALGAIAQLSKDMLDDEDEGPGLAPRSKSGNGVLSRSIRGQTIQAVTTRRAARKGALPVRIRDAMGDSQESSPTVSPRKRKAASNTDEPDQPLDDPEPPRPTKRVVTATTRSSATGSGKTTASRASGLPVPTASLPSTSRLSDRTVSTSLPKARRVSAQSASTAASEDATVGAGAAAEIAPKAPRRARRILLGRAGPGGAEEEEEIDGVPVVRRRKKAL